jgi:hypothetical protein
VLILVGAIWLLCIVYLLVGSRELSEKLRLDNDPRQEQLARLLIAAGLGAPIYKITSFLSNQADWSLDEDRKRVAHALTLAEKLVDPAVYEKACEVGLIFIEASRSRGHPWRCLGHPLSPTPAPQSPPGVTKGVATLGHDHSRDDPDGVRADRNRVGAYANFAGFMGTTRFRAAPRCTCRECIRLHLEEERYKRTAP